MNRSDSYKSAVDEDNPSVPPQKPPRPPLPIVHQESLSSPQFNSFNLIEYYLEERKHEYTTPTTIKVFCGTFNVNGKEPPTQLDAWLLSNEPSDLYAIGFQELQLDTDAYTGQYLTEGNKKFQERQARWRSAVIKTLSYLEEDIVKISEERLVGMYLIICARKKYLNVIKNVRNSYLGTGIGGFLGNKGGIGIRLDFYDAQICFICSHLAAHQSEVEKRNRNYRSIKSGLRWDLETPRDTGIENHTHVIWLGDLNYRIDLDIEAVRDYIKLGNLEKLFENDQLIRQKSVSAAFRKFHEPQITFNPTYKFDPGTDNYDSSPKNRIPAYTDRILFYSKETHDIIPDTYRSHNEIKFSDHKPVSATFKFTVPVRDEEKYREVHREVISDADKSENERLPSISLSSQHIDFGDVYFNQTYTHNIQLCNTGVVPAMYQIKDSREELQATPTSSSSTNQKARLSSKKLLEEIGIFITPTQGVIPCKGDQTLSTVQFQLTIDTKVVSKYNMGVDGKNPLDSIILLVQLGDQNDVERPPAVHYITMSARWHFSVFGMPRKVLCQKGKTPLAELTYELVADLNSKSDESRGRFIPMELWKIMDEIFNRGMKEDALFLRQGVQAETENIIRMLDSDSIETLQSETLPGEVKSIAEVLLLFLNAMPEPIIPYSHYDLCIGTSGDNAVVKNRIQANFPSECQTLFEYITSFLRELCKPENNQVNRLTPKLLADLFQPPILKPDPNRNQRLARPDETEKAKEFLVHFITPKTN